MGYRILGEDRHKSLEEIDGTEKLRSDQLFKTRRTSFICLSSHITEDA
jgi:hypothetical protein